MSDIAKYDPKNFSMERPAAYGEDHRGTEHITKDDLQLPWLGLAQANSPQVVEGDPKFIPGLKSGDMFNTISGEIYGRGPLHFAVIRGDKPRGIEFKPMDEGGGIVDFNVALDDPRMKWTAPTAKNPKGKPIATKFYDFIVYLLRDKPEPIVLSMKSSNITMAKKLNSFISARQAEIFAGVYTITVQQKMVPKPHWLFDIKNAGWVPKPSELYTSLEAMFNAFKDKKLSDAGREPGDEGDDFPTDEPAEKSGPAQQKIGDM